MSKNRLELIKKIRALTHAGFSLCVEALKATENNLEKAISWLRQRGIAKAQKKASRIAGEGRTGVVTRDNIAILYQLRCETDFVVRNQKFIDFFEALGKSFLDSGIETTKEILQIKINNQSLKDAILELTSSIGEKIELGKVKIFTKTPEQIFGSYIHTGGKSSALIVMAGSTNKKLADMICMHIVAMQPLFISSDDINEEYKNQEKTSITEAMAKKFTAENTSSELQSRIINGKFKKHLSEITLLEQKNIHNEKEKIEQTLKTARAKIMQMAWITKKD